MKLVIVESPTKAKTIGKFLGENFDVQSSYGHVRDLPKSKIGVDVEKNFEPQYVIPTKSRKNVNTLKKKAATAENIILATDEDREGEAIAWHLTKALGLENVGADKIQRIVFHEITKTAIDHALGSPRKIDKNLVDAQQARRVLDRLVGYLLSPFLWKKVIRGLSAGRVQSVALRLIAEREEEIKKFKADEYWTIDALFKKNDNQFEASLSRIDDKPIPKLGIKNREEAQKIIELLKNSEFKVSSVEKRELKKNPFPPFITSTLQQAAFQRLHFSARQTMRLAQNLYEEGHITYMRTDSTNLSKESLDSARKLIGKEYGPNYLLSEPRLFKTKSKLAQEAHEAIRPTNPGLLPETLESQDASVKKLYELIWRRFIASQLPQAIFDSLSVEILNSEKNYKNSGYSFRASGSVLKFDGFLKAWPQKLEERDLPELKIDETLEMSDIKANQHFTEPPPRYNEASLIKALENFGIGRPSTYAPIISVIQDRNYVAKNEARRFEPTEVGVIVNKVLTEHFPEVVDIQFTARMEGDLDEVAEGKINWQDTVREFYEPFSKNLEKKYEEVAKKEFIQDEKTDEKCGKCGRPMVIKTGRFGKFLACTGFPECKNTKSLHISLSGEKKTFGPCPKCGTGEIVMKRTKKRRFFYGCSRYPDCDHASWKRPEETAKEE